MQNKQQHQMTENIQKHKSELHKQDISNKRDEANSFVKETISLKRGKCKINARRLQVSIHFLDTS